MEPFTVVTGPAAPLLLPDVDTDVIAPAHGPRGDLSRSAFAPLRYRPDGGEDPAFVLNRDPFRGAPILLAGRNFGCGSSRETAVWSLLAIGVRCVIAPGFGDIFAANCLQNGVLPVVLDPDDVAALAGEAASGAAVSVDLGRQRVVAPSGRLFPFEVDPMHRARMLDGLDELDAALRRRDQVSAFQEADRRRRPWVYSTDEVR